MKNFRKIYARLWANSRRSKKSWRSSPHNETSKDSRENSRRIVLATTVDVSLGLMVGVPEMLKERGWDVHVVSSSGPRLASYDGMPGITAHSVKMLREPSPLRDLMSLITWVRLLYRLRPAVLYVGTPKAGLLACMAGWLTRVPVRVYMLRGLRAETALGVRRRILVALELTTMNLATSVVAISRSLAEVATQITGYSDIELIGKGSSNGINLEQYHRRSTVEEIKQRKVVLDIPLGSVVIGFVGRITVDKGVGDLLRAVDALLNDGLDVHLLLVGQRENCVLFESDLNRLSSCITETGPVANPAPYLELMDLFVMPSRREGFCNSLLEAAAMKVPIVAARSTGIVDAVTDGVTGLLFEPCDVVEMTAAILRVIDDEDLRDQLTLAGRERVHRDFNREGVQLVYANYLEEKLHARQFHNTKLMNQEFPP